MGTENLGHTQKETYWQATRDEVTGTTRVTVAATITFTIDERHGGVTDGPTLEIAGGRVAISSLCNTVEIGEEVVDTYFELPESQITTIQESLTSPAVASPASQVA